MIEINSYYYYRFIKGNRLPGMMVNCIALNCIGHKIAGFFLSSSVHIPV